MWERPTCCRTGRASRAVEPRVGSSRRLSRRVDSKRSGRQTGGDRHLTRHEAARRGERRSPENGRTARRRHAVVASYPAAGCTVARSPSHGTADRTRPPPRRTDCRS
eukprot:scaffold3942_cov123-Isochrysis_galbana.AAC.6